MTCLLAVVDENIGCLMGFALAGLAVLTFWFVDSCSTRDKSKDKKGFWK